MAFLEMRHIRKTFGSTVANDDVSLSVERGEIHALLGENGAGKSTLMNILYGMYPADSGEILLNGRQLHLAGTKDAIANGIGMVHQHFMLIPEQTVIENVILGNRGNPFVLNLKEQARRFTELAAKYGMEVDPWCRVDQLSVGQQQRLEILKALYKNAGILILDEPTAVLTPQEVQGLFRMMRQLTDSGCTILFITHKLPEIMDVCTRCTILRQGRTVCSMPILPGADQHELAVRRYVHVELEDVDLKAAVLHAVFEGHERVLRRYAAAGAVGGDARDAVRRYVGVCAVRHGHRGRAGVVVREGQIGRQGEEEQHRDDNSDDHKCLFQRLGHVFASPVLRICTLKGPGSPGP